MRSESKPYNKDCNRQRTQERAEALSLSAQGWKVSEIASHLNRASNPVRQTFYRWLSQGREGLFDAQRSGRAKKWKEEELKLLETGLSEEQRTYNSRQLSKKKRLAREKNERKFKEKPKSPAKSEKGSRIGNAETP
ncbi:helix-turn-helix domain-containing protein [Pleurocapsa sp. PCC 7327]|uniref:helix-turn-helix domain-containing protein n=1 Tax=Pleurocapsa sp. PCC 7327 TaxID=118163 RepID=UPI0002E0E519|nr:helix-turn-helix domain-containing protein [Pleurocapsa sp. PCC 7327]